MQNIVVDMCEKFHYDRLRNDRALVVVLITTRTTTRTTFVALGDPSPWSKSVIICA